MKQMKTIPDFPDYSITEDGCVYSHRSKKYLKGSVNKYGYRAVKLWFTAKSYNRTVHRLVMLTYKPNINSTSLQVNHIDGVKLNNALDNLEWATHMNNSIHADAHNLVTPKLRRKAVACYTTDGIFIDSYTSGMDAHRLTGIPQIKISQICRGIYEEYQGLIFKFL